MLEAGDWLLSWGARWGFGGGWGAGLHAQDKLYHERRLKLVVTFVWEFGAIYTGGGTYGGSFD